VAGVTTICGSGGPETKTGSAVHMYACTASMGLARSFANADGELLVVPQQGALDITTELGRLWVEPGEIAVLPRGVRFSVQLPDGPSRGYMVEVYSGRFRLPDLGPIGANGLANPRDFEHPVAWYDPEQARLGRPGGPPRVERSHTVAHKFLGAMYTAEQAHSPFDVVAWHGNYVPYKYDLDRFCTVNAVAFDHLDPSIFTVLTCPTVEAGVAAVDFVIFPPRWCVQDNTFRCVAVRQCLGSGRLFFFFFFFFLLAGLVY
jgi:homogentisate 1,2-dioxygenase